MKIALTLLILAAGALLADGSENNARAKIKPLQKELIATLKEAADLAAARAKTAESSPVVALQAQRQFLDATLDVAETNHERISILESIVELQKKMEILADEGIKTGAVGQIQLLQAKAARIKAEIELEKEKAIGGK